MNDFTVTSCLAETVNGGGYAFTNTGSTIFTVTTGKITLWSKAKVKGGFIYKNPGTTFT